MLRDLFIHKKRDELLQSQSAAVAENYTGAHALAQNRIGHRDASDVLHGGMSENEILNFLRADFLATTVDQILFATLDHVVSGRMESHQVTGAIKAVGGKCPRIILRHAIVTSQRVRT